VNGDATLTTRADAARLQRAFEATLIPLTQKIPHDSELRIEVQRGDALSVVSFTIPGGSDAVCSAHESQLRLAPHHYAACGGSFVRERTAERLRYLVTFR